MTNERLSLDNKTYPEEILESQFNHILESFPGIIEVIKNYEIEALGKDSKLLKNKCNELYEAIGFKSSLRYFFLALSIEFIKPIKIKNFKVDGKTNFGAVYYAQHNLPYWIALEKYRDLNFNYQDEHIIDNEEMDALMKKTNFMRSYKDGEILKFNFKEGNGFIAEKFIRSAYNLLIPIYGDDLRGFIHKESGTHYLTKDLLNIYSSILKLALKIQENTYNKKEINKLIRSYGEKQLIRELMMEGSSKYLLRLLSYDINDKNNPPYIVGFKPLIKRGKVYYILPSWILSRSHEKVIDKIFSSKLINFMPTDQKSKGYFFEDSIEQFFKSESIQFSRLERDQDNNLPEIDGMFVLGEYLFLFDAKATVKPESIVEAYNKLNDPILKAYKQLQERTETLLLNKKAQKLIKQKTGIDVSNKIIAPFILLNHHFFNGYQELCNLSNNEKQHIPIIDFLTLKGIIKSKSVPIWSYNENNNSYSRQNAHFENFESGKELYLYLLNQIKYGIPVVEKTTYQLTQDGILFPIIKPFNFE